jgi:hypothetical protein
MQLDLNVFVKVEVDISKPTLQHLAAIMLGAETCAAVPVGVSVDSTSGPAEIESDSTPICDLVSGLPCNETPSVPSVSTDKTQKLRDLYKKVTASQPKPEAKKSRAKKEGILPIAGYTTPDKVRVPGYKSTYFLESVNGVVCLEYYSNHVNVPWTDIQALYAGATKMELTADQAPLKERVAKKLAASQPPMEGTRRVLMVTQFLKAMHEYGLHPGSAKEIFEKTTGKRVADPDPCAEADADFQAFQSEFDPEKPILTPYYSTRPDENAGKIEGTLEG